MIDPINTEFRGVLKLVDSLVTHSAPLRIGLVFNVNASSTATANTDAGVAMVSAFNFVVQKRNPSAALSFLTAVIYIFLIYELYLLTYLRL